MTADLKFRKRNPLFVAIVLVLAIVISVTAFAACKGKEAAESQQSAVQDGINEETFVLADGITFGALDLSGKVYKDARALAEEECLKMINDFTLTVNAEDKKFAFNKDSFLWDTNVDDLLKQAVEHTNKVNKGENVAGSMHFELDATVNKISVEEAVSALAQEVDVLPVNANIDTSGKEIKFTKEKKGYQVDQTKLVEDMISAIAKVATGKDTKAEVTAQMKKTDAAVKMEDIEGNVTLLATFSTTSTSTANGNHNMKTALNACNGSVIEPGAVWSFNACTGDSNLTSSGYLPGTVIINGEFEQGVGGGICQASTTIYNAAVRANLQVVERYSHYYPSTYADPGMDATIDYPALDLKLKNITEYPIYIQCYMEGTKLYCSIYGWQDPSFDEIKVTSYFHGHDRENNVYYGSAYRTFYKDGKELYSEDLPGSVYRFTSHKEHTKPTTEPTTEATQIVTTVPVESTTNSATVPSETQTPTESVTPTQDVTQAPTPAPSQGTTAGNAEAPQNVEETENP